MLSTSAITFPKTHGATAYSHLTTDHHRLQPQKLECKPEHSSNLTVNATLPPISSTNEPVASQLETYHPSKFLETYVQEDHLSMSPFENSTFGGITPSLISLNSDVFQTNQKPLKDQSHHEGTEHETSHYNTISTFPTDSITSCLQGTNMGTRAFDQPVIVSLACESYLNYHRPELGSLRENVVPEARDTNTIDFTAKNTIFSTGRDMNNQEDFKTPSVEVIHKTAMTPTVFKQTATSVDKKEMRARRNRESARRSRMKSKQHFHFLETTFVFMNKENKALRLLVEKLLSKCVEKSPRTRGKLQSLLAERL